MSKLIKTCNRYIETLLAVILIVMFVVLFAQIFCRFILEDSLAWSEELARFLMIWLVMLGSAVGLHKGQLLCVDFVVDLLGKKKKAWMKVFADVISLPIYLVIFVLGIKVALSVASQTSPGLKISMFWVYLALPVGGAFLIINSIDSIVNRIKTCREGDA